MPQHDYVIDNQLFPATRTDLNNALQAIASKNSGATAPTVTYPFMEWVDTSTTPATIRKRNAGNTAWIVVGFADTTNLGLATIESPALTGTPSAPTATASTSTTQIATTAFVQSAIANNPTWVSATLLNGWTSLGSGFPAIAYRKLPSNVVVLQGVATRSSPPANSTILTLPAGFRPAASKRFSGVDSNLFVVDINTSGDLTIAYTNGTATNAFIPLDMVRFEVS